MRRSRAWRRRAGVRGTAVILLFLFRMKVPARPLLVGLGAVLALGAELARHLAQVVLPVSEVAIVLVWTVAFRKSGAQLGLSEAGLIVDVVVNDVVIVVVDVIGFG